MPDVKALAGLLLSQVEHAIPIAADRLSRGRPEFSQAQIDLALDRLGGEMRKLRSQHRLGLIESARLMLELQSRLFAAGYPPEVVRSLVFSMVMQLFTGRK